MDPPQFANFGKEKGSIDPPQPQQIIGNIDQILATDPPDVNQLKQLPDPSVCGVSIRSTGASQYGGRFHLQQIDDQHAQSSPHNRISPHRHSPIDQYDQTLSPNSVTGGNSLIRGGGYQQQQYQIQHSPIPVSGNRGSPSSPSNHSGRVRSPTSQPLPVYNNPDHAPSSSSNSPDEMLQHLRDKQMNNRRRRVWTTSEQYTGMQQQQHNAEVQVQGMMQHGSLPVNNTDRSTYAEIDDCDNSTISSLTMLNNLSSGLLWGNGNGETKQQPRRKKSTQRSDSMGFCCSFENIPEYIDLFGYPFQKYNFVLLLMVITALSIEEYGWWGIGLFLVSFTVYTLCKGPSYTNEEARGVEKEDLHHISNLEHGYGAHDVRRRHVL